MPHPSRKETIWHFTDALNENHLVKLEKYLDHNVQKTLDSQIVYKDLKEAHDYYTQEHANINASHWKVLNYHDNNQPMNTIKATVTHNGKIYNTIYTFSEAEKIQHIQATLDADKH